MTLSISADDVLDELPWLRAFAARLASPADVDDLVSQTWIAAWQEGAGVEVDHRGPRPWLGAVLRNKARMMHRSRKRREVREARASLGVTAAVEQDLSRLSVLAELVAAMRRLSEHDQSMLVQRYCEDRTAAEIGEAFGLAPGTVRSRLKRSLARLRKELDASHGGERATWAAAVGGTFAPAASSAPLASWGLIAGVGAAVAVAVGAVVLLAGPASPSADEAATGTLALARVVEPDDPEPRRAAAGTSADARKKRVAQIRAALDRDASGASANGADSGLAVAELAERIASMQQEVFDGCVADLSLSADTAFEVRSQVIGAPGVGTIVAEVQEAEAEEGRADSTGLLECVREGMYVLQAPAPSAPFEAEMSFGLRAPTPAPDADEDTPAVDATAAVAKRVQAQAEAASDCAADEVGSAVLLLAVDDDGAVTQVRFEKTTLTLDVIDCVADRALEAWTLEAASGTRIRATVQFGQDQPSP